MARDEDWFRAALRYFDWWHCLSGPAKKSKTAEDFIKSPFYKAFAAFGEFALSRAPDPDAYFKWLAGASVPVDRWTSKANLRKHLDQRYRRESAAEAAERFVLHLESWRERNDQESWLDYCSKAPDNMIFRDVKSGTVSPWIFMCMPAMKRRIDGMPKDLADDMLSDLDMRFWESRIRRESESAEWIRETLS